MAVLLDIKDYVQNIAETIKSVIGLDVTIVDNKSMRVAATGEYKNKIGEKVVDKSVFIKAVKEKKSFIVNNPRREDVCKECEDKLNCIEYAEVCSPIISAEGAIGVIGLVALSDSQRERLQSNEENLLEFLKRMGDLLATKILEYENYNRKRILLKQIEATINSIDDGIIALDSNKNIIYMNRRAEELCEFSKNKDNCLSVFLKGVNIDSVINRGEEISNINLTCTKGRILVNVKPVSLDDKIIGVIIVLRTIKEISKIINEVSLSGIKTNFDEIIGISREIVEIKNKAKIAAESNSTVLILGESGTGKEIFARAIHSASNRRERPFIAINCAAIPESLLESEFFGYEEGAFTGAKKGGKVGKFELAAGGTIFLDEIGDMPLHLQTKLLRVIQEKNIEKIGSLHLIHVDVRIIAATHKDLNSMVENGEFRQDLFYRLNVIPLNIPPLRERREDIKILMEHILNKFGIKFNKNLNGFKEEVVELFVNYSWPGNVRELENIIEYAVNMEKNNLIEMESLPERIKKDKNSSGTYNLRAIEKRTIEEVLKQGINRDEAAKILGIGRATLFRKIKEYNIEN